MLCRGPWWSRTTKKVGKTHVVTWNQLAASKLFYFIGKPETMGGYHWNWSPNSTQWVDQKGNSKSSCSSCWPWFLASHYTAELLVGRLTDRYRAGIKKDTCFDWTHHISSCLLGSTKAWSSCSSVVLIRLKIVAVTLLGSNLLLLVVSFSEGPRCILRPLKRYCRGQ